jgi:hypothetical protein
MEEYRRNGQEGKTAFVGVDLHRFKWHVTLQYGNRVKTDRRDSRKLAYLLSRWMLKRVWVPTVQECYHRHVIRRRRPLIGDRVRTQNRIKAELG